MNYYRRHIGDYAKDTSHIKLLQHGVYAKLMDVYYATEKGIPDAEAEDLINAKSRAEKRATRAVLLKFFHLRDCVWCQARCEKEIKDARRYARIAKENGKKGGRKTTQRVLENNPAGTQNKPSGVAPTIHYPLSTIHKPNNTPQPPSGECPWFEKFWENYPQGQRKKNRSGCLKKWKRHDLETQGEKIVASLALWKKTPDWVKGFVVAPMVFLNQELWETELSDGFNATQQNSLADDWKPRTDPLTRGELEAIKNTAEQIEQYRIDHNLAEILP